MSGLTPKRQEFGRSMLEMIAVIAIMGLLTIIVIPLIRWATNKAKANEIIHDGRAVQTESLARQGDIDPNWQTPDYHSETGKTFAMMRDVKGHDYVKVEGVEQGVCKYMLTMQEEGILTFLTYPDFAPFTECLDQETGNAMVFAFDGLGVPSECETTMHCELAHNSNGYYCDEDGHCVECNPDLSEVNVEGDGCTCKQSARSCSDDKGHTWCCESEKICGEEVDECVTCGDLKAANETGDGCICDATQAVTCEGEKDGEPYTWCCGPDENGNGQICGETVDECAEAQTICSYTLTQNASSYEADCQYQFTNQEEISPNADCHYTIVDTVPDATNAPNIHTITLTADPNHQCKGDKYCYLYYRDGNCGSAASADAGSSASNRDLWGVCINKNQVNTQCQKNIVTVAQVSAIKPCKSDKYCYLYYADETCGSAVSADLGKNGTANIYGVCIDKNQVNTQCVMKGGAAALTRNTGCPAGQYCYLNWTSEQRCSATVGASYMGTFYGRCISTQTNSAPCPFTN